MRLLTPKHLDDQLDYFERHNDSTVRVRGLFLCREIELLHGVLREHGIALPGLTPGTEPELEPLEEVKKRHILAAIERNEGNISAAYDELQMGRTGFYGWRAKNRRAVEAVLQRIKAKAFRTGTIPAAERLRRAA